MKQEVGWSGAYRAGGSEDCRLEVTIQKHGNTKYDLAMTAGRPGVFEGELMS